MEQVNRWDCGTNLRLDFAVLDAYNVIIARFQHPDSAERFLSTCVRTDLRVVELI